jgi:hypothetical protein
MIDFLALCMTAVVLVATALAFFVPGRHHPLPGGNAPRQRWVSTNEVYREESTGVLMRVWTDPADDVRRALPVGSRPGPDPDNEGEER